MKDAERMGYWAKDVCGSSSYLFTNTMASLRFNLNDFFLLFFKCFLTGHEGAKFPKMLQHGHGTNYNGDDSGVGLSQRLDQGYQILIIFFLNIPIGVKIGNWSYNFNYWTGAAEKGCKGRKVSGLGVQDFPMHHFRTT